MNFNNIFSSNISVIFPSRLQVWWSTIKAQWFTFCWALIATTPKHRIDIHPTAHTRSRCLLTTLGPCHFIIMTFHSNTMIRKLWTPYWHATDDHCIHAIIITGSWVNIVKKSRSRTEMKNIVDMRSCIQIPILYIKHKDHGAFLSGIGNIFKNHVSAW